MLFMMSKWIDIRRSDAIEVKKVSYAWNGSQRDGRAAGVRPSCAAMDCSLLASQRRGQAKVDWAPYLRMRRCRRNGWRMSKVK